MSGRGMVALLAAAIVLLIGCTADQAGDVALYRGISDPPGGAPARLPSEALSLQDALKFTAMYNERIAQQGERYVQALAERQRAASALRPTLELFSETSLRENTGEGIAQTAVGFGAQYRLLTGLSDLREVDASEARVRAGRWLILDLRETLLLETARAYYEVLRAERLAMVLESSVRAQSARLEDARARNEVGFTRPLDVAQIEAQVSRTRAQLITAEGNAREARATLALLTNLDVEGIALSDGFGVPVDVPGRAGLIALAHRHRQDLLAARAQADAARSDVDAAIGQYAPSIGVNLEAFLLQEPDDSPAAIASLIQIRVPIFSAGRIEADIRGAWSVFREAALEYRARARAATADVDAVLAQLRASRARLEEFSTQVRVAREALTLAEASYEAGLGTNLERVTAQDQLLSAELEQVSEEYQVKLLTLALRRACGMLAVEHIGAVLPATEEWERSAPDAPLIDRGPARTTEGA
ncbi:MAG: TolC family protein [Planctomycetota bacterium]|nr:TolC family protein [Planctomycetota bacterium]